MTSRTSSSPPPPPTAAAPSNMDPRCIENREDIVGLEVEEGNDGVTESQNGGEARGSPSTMTRKKRKNMSPVWVYFQILPKAADNKQRAKCKKCGTIYIAESKSGTGSMKRHMQSCINDTTSNVRQLLIEQADGPISTSSIKFDQERFRELLTHAIIKHDLPFQFVEYEGIRQLLTYICPEIKHISRNTAMTDIMRLHGRELNKLGQVLLTCTGRICLTSELWTSIVNDGYLCLTAHFVDKDWTLQKRIINFSYIPPPHGDIFFSEKIYNLLSSWGIKKKLFSITSGNAFANDLFVGLLRSQLCFSDALLSDDSYFHVRCCAHVINSIVQECLKEIDPFICKIRDCVNYVKGSQVRKVKFVECATQTSLDPKSVLRQDVTTRWDSTFLMLDSAIYYHHAFSHLQLCDSSFEHCPSQEEWNQGKKICNILRLFYDTMCLFSEVKYPTSNLIFPQMFLIELTLRQDKENSDDFLRMMASKVYGTIDKYWSEYNLILAIAVIFDPRYKIQFVEFCYNKLYGEGNAELAHVRDKLFSLFEVYAKSTSKTSTSLSLMPHGSNEGGYCSSQAQSKQCTDVLKEFDMLESQGLLNQKSQMELYLDEPRVCRMSELDVLMYWKANQRRYPELAQMARDVLSIPVSSIASESAFSFGGGVLDQYCSSLKPQVVEALICCRDWLFGGSAKEKLDVNTLCQDIMNLNGKDDESG